jgi:hypothetical protein
VMHLVEIPATETRVPQAQTLPVRVLVSEPDAVSHRLLCSLLEYESGMTVTCVDAPNWEAVGIKPAPTTIVTAYDPSAVSAFASTAIDFLVKPVDAERFGAVLDVATPEIACERKELGVEKRSSDLEQKRPGRYFLHRLAVETTEKIVLVKIDDIRWPRASKWQ